MLFRYKPMSCFSNNFIDVYCFVIEAQSQKLTHRLHREIRQFPIFRNAHDRWTSEVKGKMVGSELFVIR